MIKIQNEKFARLLMLQKYIKWNYPDMPYSFTVISTTAMMAMASPK